MTSSQTNSLVYVSVSAVDLLPSDLEQIMTASKANNVVNNITGLLTHYIGFFVQYIEGPESNLARLMDNIRTDPRHLIIQEYKLPPRDGRKCPNWSMEYINCALIGKDSFHRKMENTLVAVRRGELSDQIATKQIETIVDEMVANA